MSIDDKIAAGIVLYNPDNEERLKRCIDSVINQADCVYIFDNSTNVHTTFQDSIIYLTENENKGIAYALNRIMETAEADGYKWLVTMDQDSVLSENVFDQYRNLILTKSRVGILCPQIIDSRRSYMIPKQDPQKEFVDFCITSASCTSVDAWKKIGGFDEWLFIDLVDNDFCKRMRLSGYQILRLNNIIMDQQFGEILPKGKKTEQFWLAVGRLFHNDNFAKFSYKKIVHSNRVYYTCRNVIYLDKKFRNYGGIGYKDNYNCNTFVGFLLCFVLPSILRSDRKTETIRAVKNGLKDGVKKEVLAWKVKQ